MYLSNSYLLLVNLDPNDDGTYYIQAIIRNSSGIITTINLNYESSSKQVYKNIYTPLAIGIYSVQYLVYTDSGYTTLSFYDSQIEIFEVINNIDTEISNAISNIKGTNNKDNSQVFTEIDYVKAKTDLIIADPANVASVNNAIIAIKGSGNKDNTQIITEIDLVKTNTDNIPAIPAAQSDITNAISSIKGTGNIDNTQLNSQILAGSAIEPRDFTLGGE